MFLAGQSLQLAPVSRPHSRLRALLALQQTLFQIFLQLTVVLRAFQDQLRALLQPFLVRQRGLMVGVG